MTQSVSVTPGMVIAIDGPAGTGKSTTARKVAERLNFAYLDTGAMYRTVVVHALREGVAFSDTEGVAALAATMNLTVRLDPRNPRFELDGDDISAQIRTETVELLVSQVATNLAVREVLRLAQQEIISGQVTAGKGVVAEGRDVGTVVWPDAEVRILMTADEAVRLARRAGESVKQDVVARTVSERDRIDSSVVDFFTAANGQVTLDTTELNVEQAVTAVLHLVTQAQLGKAGDTEGHSDD